MVDLELDNHLHRAALHLAERASWEDLKGFLEDAHANLNNTPKLVLCSRFDQHKEWQRDAGARQPSPLTASPTTRTETSPLRPSSTRGTSPAISQIEQPQFINPVSMKDSASPKIYDNRTIEVVYRNDSNETNLIAKPACKLFGHELAELDQKLPVYYTPKGEKRVLKKMCVVRPWGKGEGEICANIIFARERSKSPHLDDAHDLLNEHLTRTETLLEQPRLIDPDEQRRYNETFHGKDFAEYFEARLLQLHLQGQQVYPQGLDSRLIHEYKFSCWVIWNSNSTSKPAQVCGG